MKIRYVILSLLLAALAVSIVWFGARWWTQRHRPRNVLLITLDTTRPDRLGCYGYTNAATPALDRLAQGGLRFARAYSHVPLTLPSHATIMTGLLPPEHGVRDNGRDALDPSVPTLAESFRSHGHRTAAFLASFTLDRRFGLARGFDVYDDRMRPTAGENDSLEMENPGDVVCDRALAWLKTNGSGPFFCWVHFYDPHAPCAPPEPYRSRFKDTYDGEIAFMDAQVARLLDFLEREGLTGSTLIVVCGDHGESFGEHRENGHGGFVYNATLRVPLLLSGPALIPPGQVDDRLAALEDVAPTLARIMGWRPVRSMRGEDLLGGHRAPDRVCYGESQYLFREFGWAPLHSLVSTRWKYIRCPDPELYDLQNDPGESANLYAVRRDVAAELTDRLDRTRAGMKAVKAIPVTLDARATRTLQSLGYLSGGQTTTEGIDTGRLKDPKAMLDLYYACYRARELAREGRFQEVIDLLDPLAPRSPESLQIHHSLAQAYSALTRDGDAAAHMEASLAIDPGDRMMFADLGVVRMARGDLAKAVEVFRRGLSLPQGPLEPVTETGASKTAIKMRASLGYVLCRLGHLDEAARQSELALKDDPANADAHLALGNVCNQEGRSEDAIRHYRAVLSVNPTNAFVLSNLGVALERLGRSEEAIRAHRTAVDVTPDSVDFRLNFSAALMASGRTNDAIAECREAVRLSRGGKPELEVLGRALAAAGRDEEALHTFEQALSTGKSAELYQNTAAILERLGRLDDATAAYRHVLEMNPRVVPARVSLGILLCRKKLYGEGIALWREGLKMEPDNAYLSYNMAWWLAACPDPAWRSGTEAREWAEKLDRATAAGNPQIKDLLAAAYAETGQFDKAVEAAKRALTLARQAGATELAAAIEIRLALYAESKPYRQ